MVVAEQGRRPWAAALHNQNGIEPRDLDIGSAPSVALSRSSLRGLDQPHYALTSRGVPFALGRWQPAVWILPTFLRGDT